MIWPREGEPATNRIAIGGLLAWTIPLAGSASALDSASGTITPARLAGPSGAASREVLTETFVNFIAAQSAEARCKRDGALELGMSRALDDAAAHDPTLTPPRAAELRRRLREGASTVTAVCERVIGAAIRADSGPLPPIRESRVRVTSSLAPKDVDAARAYFTSPAGEALMGLELAWSAEASRILTQWYSTVRSSLFSEMLVAVRAELEATGSSGGSAAAVPPARRP